MASEGNNEFKIKFKAVVSRTRRRRTKKIC